jgi:hypothetical protein
MAEALTQSHCHIRVHYIAMQYNISRRIKTRQDADLTQQYPVRPNRDHVVHQTFPAR